MRTNTIIDKILEFEPKFTIVARQTSLTGIFESKTFRIDAHRGLNYSNIENKELENHLIELSGSISDNNKKFTNPNFKKIDYNDILTNELFNLYQNLQLVVDQISIKGISKTKDKSSTFIVEKDMIFKELNLGTKEEIMKLNEYVENLEQLNKTKTI